ncbi:nitrilase-related carbon-nitrogen hydrolase [Propionibacterium sp.]|uniref:nitrilase-related carbon-nitrogen hydrolase n=1 Tax=Propionibacterium sp. TaxID=1977903 RepID=UPI0039EADE4A
MDAGMHIAIGQLRVEADAATNLAQISGTAERSAAAGARILLLPEGLTARDPADPHAAAKNPQPLEGPLISGIIALSARHGLAIAGSIHTPTGSDRVVNTGFLVDHGELIAEYRKIHLYDAFKAHESSWVQAGAEQPPTAEVDGLRIGLMICYDLRFPEVARSLAVRGAQIILVPAAWAAGPLKERHWQLMVAARALENTVYMVACSEASSVNIGCSMVVDPLGVVVASAGAAPELLYADIDPQRIVTARKALPVLANRGYEDPVLRAHQ